MRYLLLLLVFSALIACREEHNPYSSSKPPSHIWHNKDGSKTIRFDYPAAKDLPSMTVYQHLSATEVKNLETLRFFVGLAALAIEVGGKFIDVNSNHVSPAFPEVAPKNRTSS
jgi:hypothetical protein